MNHPLSSEASLASTDGTALETALARENERTGAILAMHREIARAPRSLEAMMQIIIEHSRDATHAAGGVVELVEGDEMVYRAGSGTASGHIGLRLKKDTSLSGRCVQENVVLLCRDSEIDPYADKEACRQVGVRSMVVVPLQQEGKAIGVLKVFSPLPEAFSDFDVTTLQLLAGVMSAVLSDASTRQSLRESEERFRLLVDSLPIIIWITDAQGKLTFVNRYWEEFTGTAVEEAYEGAFGEYLHPEDREASARFFAGVSKTRDPFQMEYRRRHQSGQYHWMQAYAVPRYGPEGTFVGFLGFSLDINEQKVLQEQLFESQKMESLGRLAGGVAHDFNNLLTAILGYTEIALGTLPSDSAVRDLLENVGSAGQRATDLTKQLLMYARRQMVEFRSVDIGKTLLGLIPILRQTIGEQYEVVMHESGESGYAFTNAGQVEQIVMNLVINARDAMPQGGRILLETECVTLDEDYAGTHLSVAPGDYVMFSVSDTGVGMPPETVRRIFEPFFTTKEVGKGTGLGLATVYGIVRQSKGNIWVYSEPGRGTTFRVYLPRIPQVPQTPGRAPAPAAVQGKETVLLVDDEPMIRDLASRILNEQGYRVLQARNGADALQIQSESKDEIHLLITDVVMPLMGGHELAERMGRLRPNLKTLYLSGYTSNVIVQEGILKEGVQLLVKPFNASELLQKVREALNETGSALL